MSLGVSTRFNFGRWLTVLFLDIRYERVGGSVVWVGGEACDLGVTEPRCLRACLIFDEFSSVHALRCNMIKIFLEARVLMEMYYLIVSYCCF